jgi:hypothetical protein
MRVENERQHVPSSLKEQSCSNDDIVVHVSAQNTFKKQTKYVNI